MHQEAAQLICLRLWHLARVQVEFQAIALFEKQRQAPYSNYRQEEVILYAAVGDWFTCRVYNRNESNIPFRSTVEGAELAVDSASLIQPEEIASDMNSNVANVTSYDAPPYMKTFWETLGAAGAGWSTPCRIRTPAAENIHKTTAIAIGTFQQKYHHVIRTPHESLGTLVDRI
ncbi:hypothetical protein GYMLUDRAFT_402970 [Collybiopsis luxurians FD-317 M1]|nr:hypothetical protein GYMLUDRAFT_402970 [Collybiopsis luxurians FD-317 M1]